MSLLDFLSPALTTATKAAVGQQEGKLAGSQMLRAIGLQQAQIAKEQADTDLARSRSRLATRQAGVPMLGDPDYAPAKAEEAGAVAGAQVAPHVQEAVGKEQGTAPIKVQTAVQTAQGTAPITRETNRQRIQQEGNKDIAVSHATVGDKQAVAMPRIAEGAAKQFTSSNKNLTDAVNAYGQAKAAFAEAKHGNPAALKSAILAFAGVADPKASLRQGVINMISQVDPSVRGNFDLALDRLSSGTLPPQTLANMEQLVDRVGQMHRDMYEQRRKEFLGRVPDAQAFVPSTDAMFNVPASATATPGGDHPITAKYGITPSVR